MLHLRITQVDTAKRSDEHIICEAARRMHLTVPTSWLANAGMQLLHALCSLQLQV